jgi:hypothetical protein
MRDACSTAVSNDHDIGNFMSYETLSPSYSVCCLSTNWVNPKGLEACKARSEVARSDDRGVGSTEENQDVDANHLASRKESSKL